MKNKAVENYDTLELARYNQWYSPEIIAWLTHFNEQQGEALRYVFTDDSNQVEAFKAQLESLVILKNNSKQGFCFICKEPGAGANHFIFGIMYSDKLVIVNPVGTTTHNDFYEVINSVSKNYNLNVYLSNTLLQKDEEGLYSCGPICVELIRHISTLSLEDITAVISGGTEIESCGLKYRQIDIKGLLPTSLLEVLQTTEEENGYVSKITAIRENHRVILENYPIAHADSDTLEAQNELLDKHGLIEFACQKAVMQHLVWNNLEEAIAIINRDSNQTGDSAELGLAATIEAPKLELAGQQVRKVSTVFPKKQNLQLNLSKTSLSYWYSDSDMDVIGTSLLKSIDLDGFDVDKQFKNRVTLDLISTLFENDTTEGNISNFQENKPVFMCYNIGGDTAGRNGGTHWVAVCVIRLDGKLNVLYKDSKGEFSWEGKASQLQNASAALEAEFSKYCNIAGIELNFAKHCGVEQQDDNSCGPMTLKNLQIMAQKIKEEGIDGFIGNFTELQFCLQSYVEELRQEFACNYLQLKAELPDQQVRKVNTNNTAGQPLGSTKKKYSEQNEEHPHIIASQKCAKDKEFELREVKRDGKSKSRGLSTIDDSENNVLEDELVEQLAIRLIQEDSFSNEGSIGIYGKKVDYTKRDNEPLWDISYKENDGTIVNFTISQEEIDQLKSEISSELGSAAKELKEQLDKFAAEWPKLTNPLADLAFGLTTESSNNRSDSEVAVRESIVFIGKTRAGKSTLVNYLTDPDSLEVKVKGRSKVIDTRDNRETGAKIIHGGESGTKTPNKLLSNDGILYIDCPGFEETSGSEQEISNAFHIQDVFNNTTNTKIVWVISWHDLKAESIRDIKTIADSLGNLFDDVGVIANSISLIVTKVPAVDEENGENIDINYAREVITDVCDSLEGRASRIFDFILQSNNIALFGRPYQTGALPDNTEISTIIANSSFIESPAVHLSVSDVVANNISNWSQEVNDDATAFIEEVSSRIVSFYKSFLERVDSFVALKKYQEQVVKKVKLVENAGPAEIVNVLASLSDNCARFIEHRIKLLEFAHQVNADISYSLDNWLKSLKDVREQIEKSTNVTAEPVVNNSLKIHGVIVDSETILEKAGNKSFNEIIISAASNVFFNTSLTANEFRGVNMSVVSPYWKIPARGTKISLVGLEGEAHGSEKAANGVEVSGADANGRPLAGNKGQDGLPGNPGGNGGNFFGIGLHITNLNKLVIDVSGGKGGKGQDGGDGSNGENSREYGDIKWVRERDESKCYIEVERVKLYIPHVNGGYKFYAENIRHNPESALIKYTVKYGYGGAGGDGGKGGIGGVTGNAGEIILLTGPESQPYKVIKRYEPGESGNGGNYGGGGQNGQTYYGEYLSSYHGLTALESVKKTLLIPWNAIISPLGYSCIAFDKVKKSYDKGDLVEAALEACIVVTSTTMYLSITPVAVIAYGALAAASICGDLKFGWQGEIKRLETGNAKNGKVPEGKNEIGRKAPEALDYNKQAMQQKIILAYKEYIETIEESLREFIVPEFELRYTYAEENNTSNRADALEGFSIEHSIEVDAVNDENKGIAFTVFNANMNAFNQRNNHEYLYQENDIAIIQNALMHEYQQHIDRFHIIPPITAENISFIQQKIIAQAAEHKDFTCAIWSNDNSGIWLVSIFLKTNDDQYGLLQENPEDYSELSYINSAIYALKKVFCNVHFLLHGEALQIGDNVSQLRSIFAKKYVEGMYTKLVQDAHTAFNAEYYDGVADIITGNELHQQKMHEIQSGLQEIEAIRSYAKNIHLLGIKDNSSSKKDTTSQDNITQQMNEYETFYIKSIVVGVNYEQRNYEYAYRVSWTNDLTGDLGNVLDFENVDNLYAGRGYRVQLDSTNYCFTLTPEDNIQPFGDYDIAPMPEWVNPPIHIGQLMHALSSDAGSREEVIDICNEFNLELSGVLYEDNSQL